MNLTFTQKVLFAIAIIGALSTAGTQLTTLFGPQVASMVTAASTLLMTVMAAGLGAITGQSGYIKEVRSMPGVETIVVNRQANSVAASLAVDPTELKIIPKPEDEAAIQKTAVQ